MLSRSSPRSNPRSRTVKLTSRSKSKDDFFKSKCNEIIFNKSKADIEKNVVCLTNKRDSKKNRRFYYKTGRKNTYLGTEREFNLCIRNFNNKSRKEGKEQIDNDKFQDSICSNESIKDRYNSKTEIFDMLESIKNEQNVHNDIYNFLKYLINKTNIDKDTFNEIMNGAFIILKDDGAFYRNFKPDGFVINYETSMLIPAGMSIHKSSHWSGNLQYRLGKGELITGSKKSKSFDLLVGTSVLPNFNGCTWFQFENSRITSIFEFLEHSVDFLKYQTGSIQGNIGPFGNSKYTELKYNGPLIVDTCDDLENCLFEGESPIVTTRKYWESEPLKISDYLKLTKIIYQAGNSLPTFTGANIRRLISNYFLRYKEVTKPFNMILNEVRDKIRLIPEYKFINIFYCFNDPQLAIEPSVHPDILLMKVFNIIYNCINMAKLRSLPRSIKSRSVRSVSSKPTANRSRSASKSIKSIGPIGSVRRTVSAR